MKFSKNPNEDITKLSELGEIEILRSIIFSHHKRPIDLPNALGDDCVDFPSSALEDRIVWTMDPTPLPVPWLIGNTDYYIFGWYSVTINLSDIASMGATPFGLLLSLITSPEMTIGELKRFLKGVEDCCQMHNTYILGGNIKDGKEFSCVGTALGSVKNKQILRRRGCKEGDFIIAIGETGAFWAAVFSHINKLEVSEKYSSKLDIALNRPVARVKEGQILSWGRLASSCMDNSDSIISCCYEMAFQNNLDFILTIKEDDLDPYYVSIFQKSKVNPLTAACSWGDWNLICTIPAENFSKAQSRLKSMGSPVLLIGRVEKPNNTSKGASAYYLLNNDLKPLNKAICSERFTKQSYFIHGLESYIEILRNQRIWVEDS